MRVKQRRILQCLFIGSFTYIVYKNFMSADSDDSKTLELFQYIKQDGTIDSVNGDFKPEKDVYCIHTIEQFRTADGIFVIPPDVELKSLPDNVIDCLYQRITTTIQYFCAKRSRHGSIRNGWNICTDGCNTPNSKTVIYVLSIVDDYENVLSVDLVYKINVQRHKPSTMNGKQIYTSQKRNHNIGGQTNIIDTWSDAVKHESNGQDILIIDVGKLTEQIVDHVINSGVLNVIQQLSIRISYGDPMSGIDYLAALQQLRKIIAAGFRIYWSRPEWSCIISGNKDRTSCVYLDMNLTADIERIRVDFTRMKEQNEKLLEEKGYLKAEKTALEKHCSMLKEKEEEYKKQHTNEDLNLNGKERETRKRCIKKPPMSDFMCEPAKKKACSSKQHSEESVLPFPLPSTSIETPPPVENTIEDKSNDCHIVDWNGKVFLALKTLEKSYIFCKRPIGHMAGDKFISNENKDSYVLNRKDIQGDQEGFIIGSIKCNVNDNKICLLKPTSTLKDIILNYMKDEGPKDEGPKEEESTENNLKNDMADDTSK